MRRVYYEGRSNTDGEVFWFQDSRTGCEKQTVYFERIRQLDSELITKEQKNLVSAMERLKQLKYPRRKPFVLDQGLELGRSCGEKYRGKKSENGRSALHCKERGVSELSLNAKQMEICVESRKDRQLLRPGTDNLGRRLHPINDDIKILSRGGHAIELDYHGLSKRGIHSRHRILNIPGTRRSTRAVPICDVLFPSLPCIPNVGHKTNIEIENKLRILELANGEFQTYGLASSAPKTLPCERRNETRGRRLGGNIREKRRQSDAKSPVLMGVGILDVISSQKESESVVEIESSGTQITDGKCDAESLDTSDTRQPPPPTRVNSHKSTPESKGHKNNPLPVTIKVNSST